MFSLHPELIGNRGGKGMINTQKKIACRYKGHEIIVKIQKGFYTILDINYLGSIAYGIFKFSLIKSCF